MINFLQVNLNGNWDAQQLLDQTVVQRNVDVLILSEPHSRGASGGRTCLSLDKKASVGTTPEAGFVHDDAGSGNGFAWMRLKDLTIFSCYWRPGTTLAEYETILGDLEDSIRAAGDSRIILAGDFNAWNVEWGSRTNNPRGALLSDLAASLGLSLANTGDTPTFVRGEATSVIDVTFSRGVDIRDWAVLDELNLSDHAYVAFSVDPQSNNPHPGWPLADEPAAGHPGWALKKMNLEAFYTYVTTNPLTRGRRVEGVFSAEAAAESFDSYITEACNMSMPLRTPAPRGRKTMYWWTDDIADLRSTALSLRRRYQSCLRRYGPDGSAESKANYTTAKKKPKEREKNIKGTRLEGPLCFS